MLLGVLLEDVEDRLLELLDDSEPSVSGEGDLERLRR